MSLQSHHVLPITLQGPNIEENIIRLDEFEHSILHKEQDVPSDIVRAYRKKTNDILIPSEFSLLEKLRLWKLFFKNIANNKEETQIHQLCSLARYRQLEQIRSSLKVQGIFVAKGRAQYQSERFLEGIIEAQIQRIKDHTR